MLSAHRWPAHTIDARCHTADLNITAIKTARGHQQKVPVPNLRARRAIRGCLPPGPPRSQGDLRLTDERLDPTRTPASQTSENTLGHTWRQFR